MSVRGSRERGAGTRTQKSEKSGRVVGKTKGVGAIREDIILFTSSFSLFLRPYSRPPSAG